MGPTTGCFVIHRCSHEVPRLPSSSSCLPNTTSMTSGDGNDEALVVAVYIFTNGGEAQVLVNMEHMYIYICFICDI